MDCRLLALDTSTRATGIAVFDNAKFKTSGTLMLDKTRSSYERFEMMTQSILDTLDRYNPQIVVIEQSIMTRNAETFRLLSMLVGVVYGYCIEHGIDYYNFTPSAWRAQIDGEKPRKRAELKQWSCDKVLELYDIDTYTDDEADAILIGTAFINMMDKQEKL